MKKSPKKNPPKAATGATAYKCYYAVAKGWTPGVYTNWGQVEKQVNRFLGSLQKKFKDQHGSQCFVNKKHQETLDTMTLKIARDPPVVIRRISPTTNSQKSSGGRPKTQERTGRGGVPTTGTYGPGPIYGECQGTVSEDYCRRSADD
jgi:hypothetical protein